MAQILLNYILTDDCKFDEFLSRYQQSSRIYNTNKDGIVKVGFVQRLILRYLNFVDHILSFIPETVRKPNWQDQSFVARVSLIFISSIYYSIHGFPKRLKRSLIF